MLIIFVLLEEQHLYSEFEMIEAPATSQYEVDHAGKEGKVYKWDSLVDRKAVPQAVKKDFKCQSTQFRNLHTVAGKFNLKKVQNEDINLFIFFNLITDSGYVHLD